MEPILGEFVDFVTEEISHDLPPKRNIQLQIYLKSSSIFPNKSITYRMSPKEHKELKRQFDDFFNKGLVQESKSSYEVQVVLGTK